jgi:hypothetical protein
MKKIFQIMFTAFFIMTFIKGQCQQVVKGVKQTIDMTADTYGNATVEVYMKLDASQWDAFKRTIGDNVSLIKRSMERAMPKYFLTDFNYSEEPMERAYRVKFKALGICSQNKNGVWVAKLDTKNPDINKVSDREFILNEDVQLGQALVQQTQKIHLPSSASGAKIEKDSFGKAVLTYKTGNGFISNAVTGLGILLMIGGAWAYVRNNQTNKSKLVLAHMKPEEAKTTAV